MQYTLIIYTPLLQLYPVHPYLPTHPTSCSPFKKNPSSSTSVVQILLGVVSALELGTSRAHALKTNCLTLFQKLSNAHSSSARSRAPHAHFPLPCCHLSGFSLQGSCAFCQNNCEFGCETDFPAVFRKHCFLVVIHHHLWLTIFLPSLPQWWLSLAEREI